METHHRIADDFNRVIMKDDTSSSVTEEDQNLQQLHSIRERLGHLLDSYKFQLIIVSLVIFDCLLVVSELLVDIRVLELQEIQPHTTEVIHAISIVVLSLFLVEILAKVFAFRLGFFRRKLEIFDAVVVLTTFALDITFRESHNVVNGTGLLIILRLWRVARILNGIVMSVKVQAERRVHREIRAREALEQELNKYRDYCSIQEQEIDVLRRLLHKHGIEVAHVEERPISGVRMDVVAEVNENLAPADKEAT